MFWKNECKRVKRLLALDAGQDLNEQERATAWRHAQGCAHCREHLQRVQAGHEALEQVRSATVIEGDSVRSVWPGVKAQLRARQPLSRRQSLWGRLRSTPLFNAQTVFKAQTGFNAQTINGWLPVGAVAIACLAILVVADSESQRDDLQFGDRAAQPFSHRLQPAGAPWLGGPEMRPADENRTGADPASENRGASRPGADRPSTHEDLKLRRQSPTIGPGATIGPPSTIGKGEDEPTPPSPLRTGE
jgi:hypothetical protein